MGFHQPVRTVFAMSFRTQMIVFVSLQLMGLNVSSSLPNADTVQNDYYFFSQNFDYPKDCKEVQCSRLNSSGVFLIKPDGFPEPFEVFCNNGNSGGWTVIQRREDSMVSFNRSWTHYRNGFGFLSSDFFLGNEKMAYLTNQADYELLIEAQLKNGCSISTRYKGFRITDEFGQYRVQSFGSFESNVGLCISGCPGNVFLTNKCTEKCSCVDSRLYQCIEDRCDDNAVCNIDSKVEVCACNDGYEGDGLVCTPTTSTTAASETTSKIYSDCKDVFVDGKTQDGIYEILPQGWAGQPFNVSCEMGNGGGWTVIQRRNNGATSFYRNWSSYKEGFGDLNGNFWLGNEKLYYLTNQKDYQLRLDIITSYGMRLDAEYTEFRIESESTNYTMSKLGSRSSFSGNSAGVSLYRNKGKQFSTYDRDNDACGNYHCAQGHRSGWWHSDDWCWSCFQSWCGVFPSMAVCDAAICTGDNLNGVFRGGNGDRIFSGYFDGSLGTHCDPPFVEMKIRPSS